MSWSRGSKMAETLWQGIESFIPPGEQQNVATKIIDLFEDHDAHFCDDHPLMVAQRGVRLYDYGVVPELVYSALEGTMEMMGDIYITRREEAGLWLMRNGFIQGVFYYHNIQAAFQSGLSALRQGVVAYGTDADSALDTLFQLLDEEGYDLEYLAKDIMLQYEPSTSEGNGKATFYCLRADNLTAYRRDQ